MTNLNTDEIRNELGDPKTDDALILTRLYEVLNEIDRLREGPWEPKRRKWEKMIEQRTKEACIQAAKDFFGSVEYEEFIVEDLLQAIDSMEVK